MQYVYKYKMYLPVCLTERTTKCYNHKSKINSSVIFNQYLKNNRLLYNIDKS